METYPEMNEKIIEILRFADIGSDPCSHYAAARIEELEAEVERLQGSVDYFTFAASSVNEELDDEEYVTITVTVGAIRQARDIEGKGGANRQREVVA